MSFINPKNAIEALDIRPGMTVADFGCGAGFYTIPFAQRLGETGKVYAFDIRAEMLEVVRSKARTFGLNNVEAVRADLERPEGSHLKAASTDLVIVSNILFQVEDKKTLAAEALRILKPGGRILAVEWSEEKFYFGPPLKSRLNRKEAEDIFLKAGLRFEKEFSAGDHHYGLIFQKP
ncbi:MAG: methyltransferase domain-containing protein [bacterium]|nr:methyltransferase domain-containing protein [bacterium]